MFTDDEKDYIMRMIKEIARVLASVMLGKKYVQLELPVESKYQISGDKLLCQRNRSGQEVRSLPR